MGICCSYRDIGACPYACLAFPCPCSTNCCGIGIPPCGYNPLVFLIRYTYYREFSRFPRLQWLPLTSACSSSTPCCDTVACLHSVPMAEWRSPNAKFTFIVSHGNGQDLQYLCTNIVPRLQGLRTPVNIVCYEYPGYSLSALPTSEWLCLRAAEAAYHYVLTTLGTPQEQIVIYGISLGTGPAVHTAANHSVGGLILQSPYTSIGATKVGLDLARRLWCIDLFQSYRLAPDITVPVYMYHGMVDEVVPPQCSEDLANLFPKVFGGQPVFCSGAGHNNVIELLHDRRQYLPMIDAYLAALSRGDTNAVIGLTRPDEVPLQWSMGASSPEAPVD